MEQVGLVPIEQLVFVLSSFLMHPGPSLVLAPVYFAVLFVVGGGFGP